MRIEIIHEIASSLRNNKLRTALTGFAVSWGIFLLIALLGAGNGLMNSFMGNIQDYVTLDISVEGWRTSKPYKGYKERRRIQLDQKDVNYTKGTDWEGVIENVTTTTSSTSSVLSLEGRTVGGWINGLDADGGQVEERIVLEHRPDECGAAVHALGGSVAAGFTVDDEDLVGRAALVALQDGRNRDEDDGDDDQDYVDFHIVIQLKSSILLPGVCCR